MIKKENAANDFEYTDKKGGITITKYIGKSKKVVIPAKINNLPVVAIGDHAFREKMLISVTIPDSVATIGQLAFFDNKLTKLTIPNSVTSIGEGAFRDNKLTKLTIPNSVTSIGEGAFRYNKLAKLTIPDSVKTIGKEPFDDEVSIIWQNKNPGSNFTYTKKNDGVTITGLVEKTKEVVIPSKINNFPVVAIGYAAFSKNWIVNVTIPDSVISIGDFAFTNNKLTSVTIPDSVTSIGKGAFNYNQLTSLTISDSVTSIGEYAFTNNKLKNVTIPTSVTSVGRQPFDSNVNIKGQIINLKANERLFVFQEGSSQKFWNIEINKTKIIVTSGKLGTAGRSSFRGFAGEDELSKKMKEEKYKELADKLISEKIKEGYKELANGMAMPDRIDGKKSADKKLAAMETAPKRKPVQINKVTLTNKAAKKKKPAAKGIKKLGLSMDDLWKGSMLASIAHAIFIVRCPEDAYNLSWDGINYNMDDDNTRGTISFADGYCVGVLRDIEAEYLIDFKPAIEYLQNAPEKIIDLAEKEALQYKLYEIEGKAQPLITAAFWGDADGLFTNDDFDYNIDDFDYNIGVDLLQYGAMVRGCMEGIVDTELAIEALAHEYEFSDEEVELLKSIYERKIANPNDPIILTKEEIAMIGTGGDGEKVNSEGMKECAASFKEIGVYFEKNIKKNSKNKKM